MLASVLGFIGWTVLALVVLGIVIGVWVSRKVSK